MGKKCSLVTWDESKMNEKHRLPGLDGMRAISIALVIFAHVAQPAWYADYGVFGVNIFFVISGFIITWLLCQEEHAAGCIHVGHFYWKRAFRILPPAVLYLVAANSLFGIDLRDVAHCLFFVRNDFDGPVYTAHYWSLSIEEQFYLLWPVMFLFLRKPIRRIWALGTFVAIEPLWAHLLYRMAGGPQNVNPMRFDLRFSAIAFGCLLALLKDRYPALFRGQPPRWTALPIIGLLALAVSQIVPHTGLIVGIVEGITVAALINIAVETPGGFLEWKPIRWIGTISYSLYLWQQMFCEKTPVGWFGRFPQNVLCSIAAATISTYLVEKPAYKLRDKWWRPRRAVIETAPYKYRGSAAPRRAR
jgi:peptidoglycan/LPS O-acetylase OafA/YrhL